MKTIRFLAGYIRGFWKDTILTWVMVFIESACEVLIAFFMQYLINSINSLEGNGASNVYMYAGIIGALAIVAAFTGIGAGYFASSAAAGFGKNLRQAMFEQIQKYSFSNIDKFSTSSIVTRTTTDVTNVQNAFQMLIRTVIRSPLLAIFATVMCFVTQWQLAWIFLVIMPIVLGALIIIATVVHPIFVKIFDTYDNLNEYVQEDVDGIRVVKSFNREDYQGERFNNVSAFIYRNFVKAETILAGNNPIVSFASYAAIIVIAVVGANIIVSSNTTDMDVGSLSTLVTYAQQILMALMMLSMIYVMITIARNSAERIKEIIIEEPEITTPINAITEIVNGDVEFKHVSYAYSEGKDIIHDVSAKVPAGSMIGILGPTGSGKTTLTSLLARLFDVKSPSEVIVAGHNVKEYDLVSLRDSVAVVLQKNTLFTGTIRENLKWGNENATDEEIMLACDAAQVTPFLKDLPEGLDTMLVEGGTNVSGGQKQRLCIARALLKNPKILILDDSTSACDTHTDALIREALQNKRKDITKFIIAQRVLSVKDCDEIWVMNEGRIIDRGTDRELMKTSQVYRELVESQLGGDFDAPAD